jgi:DUF4097 and DUF4098 domain-containing protein YvlB
MGVATAALVVALTAQQAQVQERGVRAPQTDQTVPVTRGMRLGVNNFAGEVVVHSWDKDLLRVQARHSMHTRVGIKTAPGGISIDASGPAGSVDYDITAPSWMPIKIEGTYNFVTVDGVQSEVSAETVRGDIVVKGGTGFVTAKSVEGEVIVEGARGRVTANSVNEGIKITGASGEISAETINGSITLSRVESTSVDVSTVNGDISYEGTASDSGKYRFTTHNGDISVTLPETANVTFSVRIYNGDFSSSLPVKGPGAGEARKGKRLIYTLGTGAAEMELESFGGEIRLRRAGAARTSRE